jgi:hypothetical protein
MRSIAVVLVIGVGVGACAGSPRSNETLLDSVRTYHEGIRWSRIPVAASRVPAEERADFITAWDKLSDDLRITDYELVQVAQGDQTSKVEVKYTWYLDSQGVVHETRAAEEWERHGKVWLRVSERRLRGEQMPGLAEPEPEPEPDSADSPVDSVEPRGD